MEVNYVRDCIINVFPKSDFYDESLQIRNLDVLDDISLMVIDRNVENRVHEINNL